MLLRTYGTLPVAWLHAWYHAVLIPRGGSSDLMRASISTLLMEQSSTRLDSPASAHWTAVCSLQPAARRICWGHGTPVCCRQHVFADSLGIARCLSAACIFAGALLCKTIGAAQQSMANCSNCYLLTAVDGTTVAAAAACSCSQAADLWRKQLVDSSRAAMMHAHLSLPLLNKHSAHIARAACPMLFAAARVRTPPASAAPVWCAARRWMFPPCAA